MGKSRKKKHGSKSNFDTGLEATPGTGMFREKLSEKDEFLRALEMGNLPTVTQFIHKNPDIVHNLTDIMGRTPLQIAVESEHLEIVELLMEGHIDPDAMYDALLLAISLDHDDIAIIMLKHPSYNNTQDLSERIQQSNADSLFSSETTPLILAAQRNLYEVVSYLINKGERIEEPHAHHCECESCVKLMEFDELKFARSRLNCYRGLSSESYISLASIDPILTAFHMRRTLKKTAKKEKHYRDEYIELAEEMEVYVVRLLDNVRDNYELDLIINEREGYTELGDSHVLPRLKLAIKYDEKQFVTHPSVQKYLTSLWSGDVKMYKNKLPIYLRPFFVCLLIFLLPIISIVYWLAPHKEIMKFLNIPYVKFIGQTLSFLVFLLLIITYSFTESPNNNYDEEDYVHKEAKRIYSELLEYYNYSEEDTDYGPSENFSIRKHEPNFEQIVLCAFILGLVWQECKQLYSNGILEHFSIFNVIDFLSLSLYITSFSLRFVCYDKTTQSLNFLNNTKAGIDVFLGKGDAQYNAYWIGADRYYWNQFDPMHVAEGLFAIANVLSFCRLFYLLAASEIFGPLQVSLLRMMGDVSNFFVIFLIILAAFLVGLNNLYWYYHPTVRGKVETNDHGVTTNAEEAFGNVERTFMTVFWALFGMGDSDVVELGGAFSEHFTERIGYLLYGAYNVAMVIVLLNMLIAMMSRSFEIIAEAESMEWKFARAQLYMDYITDSSFLPVPFNIFPIPYEVYLFCKKCYLYLKHEYHIYKEKQENSSRNETEMDHVENGSYTDMRKKRNINEDVKENNVQSVSTNIDDKKQKSVSFFKNIDIEEEDDPDEIANKRHADYVTCMKRVVKRYIFESEKVDVSPLEGEIEELKQDLSSFRFEMTNLVKTEQKMVKDLLNMVSAKLDMYTAYNEIEVDKITRGKNTKQTDTKPVNKEMSVFDRNIRQYLGLDSSPNNQEQSDGDKKISNAGNNIVEETIVPQTVIYQSVIPEGNDLDVNQTKRPKSTSGTPHKVEVLNTQNIKESNEDISKLDDDKEPDKIFTIGEEELENNAALNTSSETNESNDLAMASNLYKPQYIDENNLDDFVRILRKGPK